MRLCYCTPEPYNFIFFNLVHYKGHNGVGTSRSPDIVHDDAHLGPKRTFKELLAERGLKR